MNPKNCFRHHLLTRLLENAERNLTLGLYVFIFSVSSLCYAEEGSQNQAQSASVPSEGPVQTSTPTAPPASPHLVDDPQVYEQAQQENLKSAKASHWAFTWLIHPYAYRYAEFRVGSASRETANPHVYGFSLQLQRTFGVKFGVLSGGLGFNFYGKLPNTLFKDTIPMVATLSGITQYRAEWAWNQWVVPVVRMEYEGGKVRYHYNSNGVSFWRFWLRPSAGIWFWLNPTDPLASHEMESDLGVKKVHLALEYSHGFDFSRDKVNLTDSMGRIGLNFDF